MNRKSAIATAGGLVASFAAGVAAVTFNWGIANSTAATTSAATPSPSKTPKVKPIIRHRTITVHKKAPAPDPVSVPSGSSGSSGSRTITLASNPVYSNSTPAVSHTGGSGSGGGGGGAGGGEGEGEGEGEGGD